MIIIDASVAFKWIQKEENWQAAKTLLENHTILKVQICAPKLLIYEIANTLATKSKTTPLFIRKGLKIIQQANLLDHPIKWEEVVEAALLAKKYHTSMYDMIYAVVAKRLKTILITADANFVKKTKFRHVKLLSQYRQ